MSDTPYPEVVAPVFTTSKGTPYLTEPGVTTLAISIPDLEGLHHFIAGFDEELGFEDYLSDTQLPPLEQLVKLAGQVCYMSFGPRRTKNSAASRYLENIKSSGHGSVLEHASVSFLLYGIGRHISHELVRHRAGSAFSQVSQRYVSGSVLRFVERPEFRTDNYLHQRFMEHADRAAADYEELVEYLLERQVAGDPKLFGESRTDRRKRVQQTARVELPNFTEAPMVMTANIRAWRHIIEMRASEHAEPEIRELAYRVYVCLREIAPLLFEDYKVIALPDGTYAVDTPYRKV